LLIGDFFALVATGELIVGQDIQPPRRRGAKAPSQESIRSWSRGGGISSYKSLFEIRPLNFFTSLGVLATPRLGGDGLAIGNPGDLMLDW